MVVQRTGFMPYFLCTWSFEGDDEWSPLAMRALRFEGKRARAIAARLNARNPGSPLPVRVETLG